MRGPESHGSSNDNHLNLENKATKICYSNGV